MCEIYKGKAATGVWRFWDQVKVVLCSEGVAAGWTEGKTRNSVLSVR